MGITGLGKFVWRWIKGKVMGLSQLKDRPHAVALGVASGTFFGFIPLFGFKTLLAMGSARLMRGNIIAAAVAVTLHDVILPLAPVMLRWEYQIGFWLLSNPHHFPRSLRASQQGPSMWFHWDTLFSVGMPLMLGSLLVAVPFGVGSYFLTLWLLDRAAKKKAALLPAGEVSAAGKKPIAAAGVLDPRKP
jgi:uncharacterized protein (DUF2062 family)